MARAITRSALDRGKAVPRTISRQAAKQRRDDRCVGSSPTISLDESPAQVTQLSCTLRNYIRQPQREPDNFTAITPQALGEWLQQRARVEQQRQPPVTFVRGGFDQPLLQPPHHQRQLRMGVVFDGPDARRGHLGQQVHRRTQRQRQLARAAMVGSDQALQPRVARFCHDLAVAVKRCTAAVACGASAAPSSGAVRSLGAAFWKGSSSTIRPPPRRQRCGKGSWPNWGSGAATSRASSSAVPTAASAAGMARSVGRCASDRLRPATPPRRRRDADLHAGPGRAGGCGLWVQHDRSLADAASAAHAHQQRGPSQRVAAACIGQRAALEPRFAGGFAQLHESRAGPQQAAGGIGLHQRPRAPSRAAHDTGMSLPSAVRRFSSRRRDTPGLCASCSSSSTFWRADASTVSARGLPTRLWPFGCSGAGPSATVRMTPSSSTTRAMSPARLTTVESSLGASSDRREKSQALGLAFIRSRRTARRLCRVVFVPGLARGSQPGSPAFSFPAANATSRPFAHAPSGAAFHPAAVPSLCGC